MARSIQWLSRVPLTLKEATETLANISEDQWQQGEQDGYRWQVRASEYGGEQQRWLVVESAQRLQSDNKAISQKIEKADKVVKKEWQKLCGQNFACEADALTEAQLWQKTLTSHQLSQVEVQTIPYYAKGGRPKQGATPLGRVIASYLLQKIQTKREKYSVKKKQSSKRRKGYYLKKVSE